MKEFLNHIYIQTGLIIIAIMGLLGDYIEYNLIYAIAIVVAFIAIGLAWLNIRKERKFYIQENIPIPLVIRVDSNKSPEHIFDNLVQDIEKKYSLSDLEQNLKKYLNIVREELIFEYTGDIYNKSSLISFIQIISYQLNKLQQNAKGRIKFHLAYYQRPSVGFLIGQIFELDGLVIYQKNPDSDHFDEVATVKDRNYKTIVSTFTKFKVSEQILDTFDNTVLVTIKASSHDIALHASSLKPYKNIITLHANHSGTITLDEDWILYAREIFTVLNKLQKKYKNITIAHAMPESIAILVGMAISNYLPIQMTQYEKGEYVHFIKLNEVKCYF
ncbi:SAVED domain-containing protein [Sulfurimonas sp.]|uniref:SAVED domain-containing protein n=1 Tax=Sulfurimonas sp. TaxID=2022749 RepID=UPI002A3723EE|nr:SAVED domain-containing protein [Sulfurimonas sp.]MDY0123765.1 SAVED domain-containing protein [Sulfurimonas sp.]